jgi:mRNA-degrading endonuclease YafQ of YafQ-DinJ toxin-antitoxin module
MYTLVVTDNFDKTYIKIVRGDKKRGKRIQKTLNLLKEDPEYPSLKSHKVNTKSFGKCWSSWITGDLRLIWNFDSNNGVMIYLLAVSEHSGTHKEYK